MRDNFTHSTWSKNVTCGIHGHTIKIDVQDRDGNHPSLPITDGLLSLIRNKNIISVYDPLFNLITNGHISGQLLLDNGRPTNKFNTIDSLAIPRGFGTNRQIRLLKISSFNQFLYVPLIHKSVGIGIKESYLTDNEKRFYGSFVFTEFEPLSKTISELVADTINNDAKCAKINDKSVSPVIDWEVAVWIK
ncbi:MAG: hypothetical protein EO766_12120 [Hydrotalea sp. AMD]|uniref:hypothetical protein n=1 Tax=Hydrotalea sp. AMD TaxID=2501297 RepID=UPI0010266918|nr:hypothetical protein [Hydrotalea sp. AMD]RWZ87264.1 MAG: hypothetical protein EO766_12120 [Hydrotalea sp. AMD]